MRTISEPVAAPGTKASTGEVPKKVSSGIRQIDFQRSEANIGRRPASAGPTPVRKAEKSSRPMPVCWEEKRRWRAARQGLRGYTGNLNHGTEVACYEGNPAFGLERIGGRRRPGQAVTGQHM